MTPENLVKARLEPISWDSDQQVIEGDATKKVTVQFNPESLKVTLSNQNASGDQRGGSAIQYVGSGTTKLSFDLWFDVTSPEHNNREIEGFVPDDVRRLTEQVAFFMKPEPSDQEGKFIPPGVRFVWGRFLFEGVMDSLDEEIQYFSEDGRPLRAKVAVSFSRQEIQFSAGQQTANGAQSGAASGRPRRQAQDGDTVPDLAGADGDPGAWPAVAAANGIENPRALSPGTLLDTSAAAGFGAGLGAGVSGGLSAGVSGGLTGGLAAGASFSAGAGASASLGGGLRAGAAAGAGLGGGLGGGIGGGIGGGLSGGVSGGLGGGLSGGVSGGLGGGIGGGLSGGVSGGLGGGLTGGVSGSLGGGSLGGSLSGGAGGLSAGASAGVSGGGAAASASAKAGASFDASYRRE